MPITFLDQLNRRRFILGSGGVLAAAGIGDLPAVSSAFAQTPTKGGRLKVSFNTRPTTLNPLKGIGSYDYVTSEMLYDGLTKIGPDLQPIPVIAESWTASGDNTEFVFKLRQGVTFKRGAPVTSADVVATIKAILDPSPASPAIKAIGPIAEVTALGPDKVVFKLRQPYADMAYSLANPNARIVPAAVLASNPALLDTEDHGSGPFKLVKFDPSQIIQVTRNEAYFGTEGPYVDAIDMVLYPDAAAEVGALLNGEMDVMLAVNPPEYARLANVPGITRLRRPTGSFFDLMIRCDEPPFNDVRVRQALAYTIDRDMIVELVLNGLGRPAYDSFISPEYPFYKQTEQKKPDIAKAKALLAAAGHGKGLAITLIAAANPPQRGELAVAFREMAKPAGFDIKVQTVSMDTFISTIDRKGNLYISSWTGQPTQDMQFTKLLTSGSSVVGPRWNNVEFDALVLAGEAESDPGKRAQIYGKAQDLVASEVPMLVPFFRDALSAHRNYVNGYFVHPLVQPNFFEKIWLGPGAPKRA
jgi:peptide/nickel transport system substrate-binding protein